MLEPHAVAPPPQPREPRREASKVGREQDGNRLGRAAQENGLNEGERPTGSAPESADLDPVTGREAPPPPPNFDPDEGTLYRPAPAAIASQPDQPAEPAWATPEEMKVPAEAPARADGTHSPAAARMIDVRIRPDKAWRETCRQVVRLAGRYEGVDALRISVSGRPMAMEFPNMKTHFCPEFLEEVENLAAIDGVDVA